MWTNAGTLIRCPTASAPFVSSGGGWAWRADGHQGTCRVSRGAPFSVALGQGRPLGWQLHPALSPRGLVLEGQELTGSGWAPMGTDDHPHARPLSCFLPWWGQLEVQVGLPGAEQGEGTGASESRSWFCLIQEVCSFPGHLSVGGWGGGGEGALGRTCASPSRCVSRAKVGRPGWCRAVRAHVAVGRQECPPLFLDTGPVGRWLPILAGPACVSEAKAEAPPCPAVPGPRGSLSGPGPGSGSGSFRGRRRRNLSWPLVSCAQEFNISSPAGLLPSAAGRSCSYSLPNAEPCRVGLGLMARA